MIPSEVEAQENRQ